MFFILVFFFKQKTAYDMRISDWSSDVCSSDLIHVEEKALNKLLGTGYFMNSVVMVDVGGKAARTLPKDVAFHPVTDRPLHVDFMRVGEHTSVTVAVPV